MFTGTLIVGLVLAPRPACADDPIDFSQQILPILSDSCFQCHGPDEQSREADLRLDQREGLLGDHERSGVVRPGRADQSELYFRITTDDESLRMPPPEANRQLSNAQIELIEEWIRQGATWEIHWAFRPLRDVLPDKPLSSSTANPIDLFINAKLEENGLVPNQAASRARRLRRLALDLTGIPPTLNELDQFVNDPKPDAYAREVDRLLASPRYGEKMAWAWLEAARYADTNGYQGDNERTMWPWRDWVIGALNADLSYDAFSKLQIAGDLLPHATDQTRLPTGFLRNHMINGEGGRIAEENRVEYVFDQLETVGTVWLGLTLQCCRCHDHKYDPLSQEDYYKFFAIFNQTPIDGAGGNPQTPPVIHVPSDSTRAKMDRLRQLRDAITPADPSATFVFNPHGVLLGLVRSSIDQTLTSIDASVPRVMVMGDQAQRRDTYVLSKGLYNQPMQKVDAALPVFPLEPESQLAAQYSGDEPVNRLTLANWLLDARQPLVARVTANRIWQSFFGNGLVKTSEDFGNQGEPPTHPELLDWLAAELIRSDWDIKHLQRLIVTSDTYQRSAEASHFAIEHDPENRWLARGPRQRMPSWMIRDHALAVSGLLQERLGGPAVKPYQPTGVWAEATFGNKHYQQDHGADLYRRSVYTYWRRIVGPTIFFDVSKRQTCTVKPSLTNTPLHALVTLNDVTFAEAARVFAQRLLQQHRDLNVNPLRQGFLVATSREPTDDELALITARHEQIRDYYRQHQDEARALTRVGEFPPDESLDPVAHATLTAICLMYLNLDESLTK